MDRRIQKSKQAIMNAFINLMSEMDFDSITINKIADTANVNRGTVYLHFVDKYDLLDQCVEANINLLLADCASNEEVTNFTSETALLRTFEHIEQNIFFYSTMLNNRGTTAFRNTLMITIQHSLSKQFDSISLNPNLNKEITVQFLASAAAGLLEWWVTHSMPYSASVMAEQLWLLLERVQPVP
jgi:AcrR family transcriptional regulator